MKRYSIKITFLWAIVSLMISGILPMSAVSAAIDSKDFPVTPILGRPTADSVTLNLLASSDVECYVEYGKMPGGYSRHTDTSILRKDKPTELRLTGLSKDAQYYYRVCQKAPGQAKFSKGRENSFHTQRAVGSDFVFTVESDYHRDKPSNSEEIKVTFRNILNEHPDFDLDLGDTFMCEKFATSFAEVINRYAEDREYFGIFGSSVPLYLVLGNHDGEQGWSLNGTEDNIAVWAAKARKLYYPNPFPDGFYSGNTKEEPFVGVCQNYYCWQWGSALFVVLDGYRYTTSDRKRSGDLWDWTLGEAQYKWFRNVLENSKAKYKFVFIHQVLGEVRGGIEWADYYEWGGKNKKGVWEFDEKRPGWGQSIHQLMTANGVTIFFHGHDHFFAKQERDGIIYQEVPQPSARNGSKQRAEQQAHEYEYKSGVILASPGHLKVSVSKKNVVVDYVHTSLFETKTGQDRNGAIVYSYIAGGSK